MTSTAGKVLTDSSGTHRVGGVQLLDRRLDRRRHLPGGAGPRRRRLAQPRLDAPPIPASTVGDAFGVGTLQSISTTGNGLGADGGRVLSATVKGTAGTVTGDRRPVPQHPGADVGLVHGGRAAGHPDHLRHQLADQSGDRDRARRSASPATCRSPATSTATAPTPAGVYRPSTATFYYRNSFAADAPLHAVQARRAGRPAGVRGLGRQRHRHGRGLPASRTRTFYLLNTNDRTASTPLIQVHAGRCRSAAGGR